MASFIFSHTWLIENQSVEAPSSDSKLAGESTWWGAERVCSQVTGNLWEHLASREIRKSASKRGKHLSMSGLLKRWEVSVLSGRGNNCALKRDFKRPVVSVENRLQHVKEMAHEGPPRYRHVVDQTVWSGGTADTICPTVLLSIILWNHICLPAVMFRETG